MKKVFYTLLLFLAAVIMLQSCKPQVPSQYLQPDEMEAILYDYHIAMGMVGENDTADFQKRMYVASVFKKHGITEAEFDSSLVYYTRHADRFQTVYENLSKRLADETVSLGASVSDVANFGDRASVGDTTNVWNGASSLVLATMQPNNVESFSLKTDTAYHKGDRLVLSFDTQFLFQDGYKDAVVILAVRLANDSVVSRSIHLSESTHYDLTVSDDSRLGIKDVRGFFTLLNNQNSTVSTLKLLFISNVRLVRCHVNDTAVTNSPSDEQPVKAGADSVPEKAEAVDMSKTTGAPLKKMNSLN